jgi:peptide/nickel transport system substrate-binding protein
LTAAGIALSGLAIGLGSAAVTAPAGASSPPPLVMESSPETTIIQDFNPFVPTGDIYNMGATGLVYEPLIEFDVAAPPKYYPWLATKYSWSNGGKSITFTIRKGVYFSDGTPLTPADVAFTYNLIRKNPSINLDGLTMTSVSTSGDTVTVNFPTAQYTNVENVAGVGIVPQSIWSQVGNPATYTDPQPIGTGPYQLASFTPQGFTMSQQPHYWQASMVHVPSVYFPVYTSNTAATTALFSGQIDWTGNFIPGLQKDFVDTAPAYHHFWEAAGSTNALWPNLNQWPTNQLAVRQAISLAVNRTVLAAEGEDGLENPVTNSSGLTLPTYAAWGAPFASDTISTTADPAAAEKVLEAAGYKKGSNGYFQLNGKTVTVTLIDPSGYTDYAANCALVAGQLKAAGIDASFRGLSVSAWNADIADGDFSLTEHWSNGGVTPYNLYEDWLDSTLASGSAATGDFERLKSTAIDTDLANFAASQTVAEQTAALAPIGNYVAKNLPIIPVTTASDWFEYNSQHYVGWPTQQDPYESGQPSGTNNGPGSGTNLVVLLHLHPRTS